MWTFHYPITHTKKNKLLLEENTHLDHIKFNYSNTHVIMDVSSSKYMHSLKMNSFAMRKEYNPFSGSTFKEWRGGLNGSTQRTKRKTLKLFSFSLHPLANLQYWTQCTSNIRRKKSIWSQLGWTSIILHIYNILQWNGYPFSVFSGYLTFNWWLQLLGRNRHCQRVTIK